MTLVDEMVWKVWAQSGRKSGEGTGCATIPFYIGTANEVQGLSHQADERDPERHQSAETICLGAQLLGAGRRHQAGRAPAAAQGCLPAGYLHLHLGLQPLPGKAPLWCGVPGSWSASPGSQDPLGLNRLHHDTYSCATQVTLVTLGVYVCVDENNVLDAEKAFVSVSLFNILKNPLNMLPQLISGLTQVTQGKQGVCWT